jgi:hypothetical protein
MHAPPANLDPASAVQALVEAVQTVSSRHSGYLARVSTQAGGGTGSPGPRASEPDEIVFVCAFETVHASREAPACRALWTALSLQAPLRAEASVSGVACGLSVGPLRPVVLFDDPDPAEGSVAHAGLFGEAAAHAWELAAGSFVVARGGAAGSPTTGGSSSYGGAAPAAVEAVLLCDNDYLETLASLDGVDVVPLLGKFIKVTKATAMAAAASGASSSASTLRGDVWRLDPSAATADVLEGMLCVRACERVCVWALLRCGVVHEHIARPVPMPRADRIHSARARPP